tara:strand:+ start:1022 stop:2959 length:1938 start_codon:yes stop_codon:yes gene_type:complete
MASTYTDLGIELMATGENAGTWGTKTNANLNLVEQITGGYLEVSIAGGAATVALDVDDGALTGKAQNRIIKLTGSITGNKIVTLPVGMENFYIIENASTDGSGTPTVQLKAASGSGATVTWAAGEKGWKIVYADGVATNTGIYDTGFSTTDGDVTLTGTQTLTNKTLTAPKIGTSILDTNGNELFLLTATASAINEITYANAAAGNSPTFTATGGDTNIGITLTPKGSGAVKLDLLTFPTVTGSANQILKSNGSGVLSFTDISDGLAQQAVKTSAFTAVAGQFFPVNTTSASVAMTLPSSPSAGDQVGVVDYAATFDSNPLLILPNGSKIEGAVSSKKLDTEREGCVLQYIDSTQGWLAVSGINEGTQALEPVTYSADFLVVAGGGSGANFNFVAGGGAGGYRTSTQTISSGNAITVTVGAGAGPGGPGQPGVRGGDSSVSGTGLTTITSTGGGGGGGNPGQTGGSGGGGGPYSPGTSQGGAGNTPSTSPSQGNPGGQGFLPPGVAGGGGGAGQAGEDGSPSGGGGQGGDGTASSITGSSVTRGGGGGGGSYNTEGRVSGEGGAGGGGDSAGGGRPASNGTANTGGGGAGAPGSAGQEGLGGSGIVIISVPDAFYSGTVTGSPTVATGVSGKTVMSFTGSGSYTP